MAEQVEKAPPAKSNGRGNPKKDPAARRSRKPPLTIPSVLSDKQRQEASDRLVVNMVVGLEEEDVRLETLQKVNKLSDDDIVPGDQMQRTFAAAREQLAESRKQIEATVGQAQLARVIKLIEENRG